MNRYKEEQSPSRPPQRGGEPTHKHPATGLAGGVSPCLWELEGVPPPLWGGREGLRVSVIIPNYNGKHLLEANLPSVYSALKFVNIHYEVIVIDDASVDDSVVFIRQHYPEIKLLVNESNKGFSPTINKGIFAAKHELILALNSDVKLSENYFIDQLKYFDATDTFGVMGKIVDLNGLGIQDGAKYPQTSFKGIKTTYNYLPISNGERRTESGERRAESGERRVESGEWRAESRERRIERDLNSQLPSSNSQLPAPNSELPTPNPQLTWLPSFFLSGANALMNREKLWQLGGFDEIYAPYYYEDADLGIRAWRVGWKCYFEPQSICMHAVSSTIGKLKSKKVKIIAERNRIILNHLHLMGWHLRCFKCWLWLRCFIKLIKGNSTIYKAIQLFRKDLPLMQQSKQALLWMQTKNNKNYTVVDTERYILKKIKPTPYRIF